MTELFVYSARCLILCFTVWFILIIIRKKSLAQLTPFDLGILMIISNVAAQPLVTKDSFKTAIGMLILSCFILFIGWLTLKTPFYRADYTPSVLIANGTINRNELKRNNMSIYTLLSLLRTQGYFKVSEINFAILEIGGGISVLPKTMSRPLTPQDMNLSLPEEGYTYSLILDGKIYAEMLQKAGVTEDWIVEQLKGIYKVAPKDVFYAEVDDKKQLYVSLI